ncbi:hypothetical protein FXO38_14924 [Capsicum annuum]|nr:hypothetical protein FXO37_29523 [Capsicum annuum]KAF3654887.1 hypothetical protein FXO38_14924 [Capsicum annuum]
MDPPLSAIAMPYHEDAIIVGIPITDPEMVPDDNKKVSKDKGKDQVGESEVRQIPQPPPPFSQRLKQKKENRDSVINPSQSQVPLGPVKGSRTGKICEVAPYLSYFVRRFRVNLSAETIFQKYDEAGIPKMPEVDERVVATATMQKNTMKDSSSLALPRRCSEPFTAPQHQSKGPIDSTKLSEEQKDDMGVSIDINIGEQGDFPNLSMQDEDISYIFISPDFYFRAGWYFFITPFPSTLVATIVEAPQLGTIREDLDVLRFEDPVKIIATYSKRRVVTRKRQDCDLSFTDGAKDSLEGVLHLGTKRIISYVQARRLVERFNKTTIKNKYPLPHNNDLFDQLQDGILVYFKSKGEHEQYLQIVLQRLRDKKLYAKLSNPADYLGFRGYAPCMRDRFYWPGGAIFGLVEFAYNNNYHFIIDMAPFEAFYGGHCRSPMGWFDVSEVRPRGKDLLVALWYFWGVGLISSIPNAFWYHLYDIIAFGRL